MYHFRVRVGKIVGETRAKRNGWGALLSCRVPFFLNKKKNNLCFSPIDRSLYDGLPDAFQVSKLCKWNVRTSRIVFCNLLIVPWETFFLMIIITTSGRNTSSPHLKDNFLLYDDDINLIQQIHHFYSNVDWVKHTKGNPQVPRNLTDIFTKKKEKEKKTSFLTQHSTHTPSLKVHAHVHSHPPSFSSNSSSPPTLTSSPLTRSSFTSAYLLSFTSYP